MVGNRKEKNMNRRSFIKMMGIAGAGCFAGAGCNVSGPPRPLTSEAGTLLNFILITADDLNYDSVGCYGCKIPQITPNIDRLAARGIKFTNAHVNIAVCQPCRQSIMTGGALTCEVQH